MAVKWYCVQTKTREEGRAKQHLENQGFSVYLPQIKRRRRSRGEWKIEIKTLFPGYLFLQADTEMQDLSVVRSTIGCLSLIGFDGNGPISVSDTIIDVIQSEEAVRTELPAESPFKRGQRVAIVEGPFRGLQGIFERLKDSERVFVLIDLLQKQHSINMKLAHLK